MINIKYTLLILFIFNLAAYAQLKQAPTPIPYFPPADPRICTAAEKLPGPCLLIYKPVCGVYVNSLGQQVKQTFSNRCQACKNANVKYVYQGTCSSYPLNSKFCIPLPPGVLILCADIYAPVCGYFNKSINCFAYPCGQTYSNACLACLNSSIDYYMSGTCPNIYIADTAK